MLVYIVIAVVVTLLVSVPVSAIVATNRHKKTVEAQIGNAENKAREIIDEAL